MSASVLAPQLAERLAAVARGGGRAAAGTLARFVLLRSLGREALDAAVSRVETLREGERSAMVAILGVAGGGACAVGFELEGAAAGSLAVLFTAEESERLLEALAASSTPAAREAILSAGKGTLREIGNIVAGAFVSAVATEGRIQLSIAAPRTIPRLTHGMLQGAIVTEILLPAPGLSCRILLLGRAEDLQPLAGGG